MKNQCKHFVAEIKTLKEKLRKVKKRKIESEKQATREKERSLVKANIPSKNKSIY